MRWGAALLLVVLAAGAGVWWAQASRFDAERWRNGAMTQNTVGQRAGMVEDLLQRHDLVGMTQSEARALLGEPDTTNSFSPSDLAYWLGAERGLVGIDSEWLVLKLDQDGVIMEARVRTD